LLLVRLLALMPLSSVPLLRQASTPPRRLTSQPGLAPRLLEPKALRCP